MKRCTTLVIGLLVLGACQDPRLVGPREPGASPGSGVGRARPAVTGITVLRSDTIDFSAYATGTQPTGWSQMWVPSPLFLAADEPQAADGKVLQWSSTTVSRDRYALGYDSLGDVTDQEVYTEFRVHAYPPPSPISFLGAAAVRLSGTATDPRGYALYFVDAGGTRTAVLATFVGGGYNQLGDAGFAWQADTWYSIRLQAVGTHIRARIWPRGTAEPTVWALDVSDTNYSAGRPGVTTHDDGTVQWDLWVGSVLQDLGSPQLVRVQLTPDTATVQATGTVQFQASGVMSDSSTQGITVNYTAGGGSITSGGLYTAGTTPGVYRVIATELASGLADTSLVTVLPPPAPPGSFTYATSFAEYPAGSAPALWTATSAPANVTWTVVTDSGVPDRQLLRAVSTQTARHILRFDSVAAATADEEVLVRIRLASSNDRGPGIALRHTMSGTTETAYVAYFRPGVNQLEVDKFPNGGFSDMADIPFTQTVGAWYWMRFRVQGSTLSLNVWADGTAEPAGWTWTGTDGTIVNGSVGVYVYEPNTVDYDGFAVGTGGLTAPTPQIAPSAVTLKQVLLTPDTASVQVSGTVQFHTSGLMSDGTTQPITVTYSATGGTIDTTGAYTAGTTPGAYRVIAGEPKSGLADTSTVTVLAPTLVGIVMTPDTATLAANATKQFQTVGKMSDGSTTSVTPTYTATGGSITSAGLYTAPNAGGTFTIIATASGFADTSTVTVLPPVTLAAVLLTPDTATVTAGNTLQFQVQGKMSDGTTGPVAVTYTAAGGTITSGGLYTAGTTAGTFRVIATAATGQADTSLVTIPPYWFTYTTNFGEYALGTPSGWTKTTNSAQTSWSIVADATALGGKLLHNVTNTSGIHILRYNAIADTTRRQEILVKLRLGSTNTRGPGVALRHTVSGNRSFNAYVAYLRPGTGVEVALVVNGGTPTVLTTQPFPNTAGSWYWLRFRADGATLSLRAWADGAQEPTNWLWTGTNSTLVTGSAGVFTNEPNTVDYDAFSFASGGLTAATPNTGGVPPTPPPPPTLQSVVLTPSTASVPTGGTVQFQASGLMSDGTTQAVTVNYSATGGTVNSSGLYTAGPTTGAFSVIATEPTSGLADTSAVTITPVLVGIRLTPDTVTLPTGATQQFQVVGLMSDGTTTAVTPTYSATGGSITSGGLYTAGTTAGSFQVIATASGFADTSTVTIVVPTIQLTARGYKVKSVDTVDLSWTVPGGTTRLDIYRNGVRIVSGYSASATVAPGVNYTDNIGLKGSGTFSYKVCDSAQANVCSNAATVVF